MATLDAEYIPLAEEMLKTFCKAVLMKANEK